MKQSLQLKLGQQLTMTPQLQQAIRLLQLSTLDLQQEIQEALDSNPMLEVEENLDSEPSDKNAEANDTSETAEARESANATSETPPPTNDSDGEPQADGEWNDAVGLRFAVAVVGRKSVV